MSHAAGCERNQSGCWSGLYSGGMPLNLWGKACLVAEFRSQSGYYITPKTTRKHVMFTSIHVVMAKWAHDGVLSGVKGSPSHHI